MKRHLMGHGLWVLLALGGIGAIGCVQTPREINVDVGGWAPRERADTTQIPEVKTLDEAKAELRKAYSEIESLRSENGKLKKKNDELKKKQKDD